MLMTGMLASAEPQSLRSNLVWMWSDPAPTALDQFCFFACTDVGLGRLTALLDDPGNDAWPYSALSSEAKVIKAKERVTVTGNPTHTGSERMAFVKLARPDGSELLPGGARRLKAIEEERRQRALQRPQQK
jgi:hypothetical protein